MKIFLDTNVLVSALATRGLCGDVLREVLLSHPLILSLPLLSELEEVLREKFGIPSPLIFEFIQILKQDALSSSPSNLLDVDVKDMDDLPLLSSALNGKADLFVTGDQELLHLKKIGDMQIISPRGFWERLKSPS
jgi:putative PIN family toxin of toxin-antitoxin system